MRARPTVDPRLSLREVEAKWSLSSPRTTISYVTRFDVPGTVLFDVIETALLSIDLSSAV
jgi:hypothetical protein